MDAGSQCENAENLGGNTKNVRKEVGDARNQGGNVSIAVEMT